MRHRLAIAAICLLAVVPPLLLYPPPLPPSGPQLAQLDVEMTWDEDAYWFGGLSGIDVDAEGRGFVAVTDRGHLMRGTLERDGERLVGARITAERPLMRGVPYDPEFPYIDGEDTALAPDDTIFVVFEHAMRVLRYDDWEKDPGPPSYTRAWRALSPNAGLESVALDEAGVLYTIPEGGAPGAFDALIYRKKPDGEWEQPFTLPLTLRFKPVGADFGPDGLLYVLERDFTHGGFRSQVRRMAVTETGVSDIETVLETPLFRHGNLEGIGVWRDGDGNIRITMVSDDNFLRLLRTQIVEYVIVP